MTTASDQLLQFLSQFSQLSSEDQMKLAEMIPVISPKKGTILLKEDQIPSECYFVLQGLVRQYSIIDGNERTTEFYTEKNGAISSEHYTDQSPSSFYLACVEDCLLIAGNVEIDEAHFKQFPVLVEITKQMIELDLNQTKKKHTQFITSSPTDRYQQLLKNRPDLINRVPLHQIASYLGLTPESLSRIRKRIIELD